MALSVQVHDYDRQISWKLLPKIAPRITESSQLSMVDKLAIFRNIQSYLSSFPSFAGGPRNNYETIVRDYTSHHHNRTGNPNYDDTDDLFADDLLALMVELLTPLTDETPRVAQLLIEHFDDMSSGMCPQGRCKRLYQLYILLSEK